MKLYKVKKELRDGEVVDLLADESQLEALRKDDRFTIGSMVEVEVKGEKTDGGKTAEKKGGKKPAPGNSGASDPEKTDGGKTE